MLALKLTRRISDSTNIYESDFNKKHYEKNKIHYYTYLGMKQNRSLSGLQMFKNVVPSLAMC